MSESTSPFKSAFDLQRTFIEQSHKATVDAIEAQQTAFDAFVDGFSQLEDVSTDNAELTRNSWMAFFDAMERTLPEGAFDFDAVRPIVDDQIDAAADAQHDAIEALVEAFQESNAAFDEFAENYVAAVDQSYDTYLGAYDEFEANVTDAAEAVDIDVEN